MKLFVTLKFAVCTMICSFSFQLLTYAQEESFISKVWVEGSAGSAGKDGAFTKFGVQTVFKDKWIGSISYYYASMNLKGTPADYKPSEELFLIFPASSGTPRQRLNVTNFMVGRFFKYDESVFFSGSAGLSIVKGDKATFTPQPVITTTDWLGYSSTSNYKVNTVHRTVAGGVIEADMLWAFCPFAAIGPGVYANINSIQSHVGFEWKIVLGWMHKGRD